MMLYDGDVFEHGGRRFRFRTEPDSGAEAPWQNQTCYGEVTDWVSRNKRPGEQVLLTYRLSRRYYDFAGAVRAARAAGLSGPRAAEAAQQEFTYLRDWCRDIWHYVGVIVTLLGPGDRDTAEEESVWGVESNSDDYIETLAYENANEILARLAHEQAEALYWANQGIATVPAHDCV